MGYRAVFQRHEKKYMLSQADYRRMLNSLFTYTRQDQYGLHTIASVYYDTDHFDLIRHSMGKPVFKEKLRLRCYGIPTQADPVFLELKRKFDGIVYKRRISLPLWEAEAYLRGRHSIQSYGQIAEEIDWFARNNHPTPKLLLAYDRIALYGRDDPELRITFDRNIRFREENLSLSQGSYGVPLIAPGQVLMEIKVNGAIPTWLSKLLAAQRIYPNSFSKYGTWYQSQYLRKGEKQDVG